jgi:hypothetical protein
MSAPSIDITDGVTTFTIENCTVDDDLKIDESEDITSGGRITSQQSGMRYVSTLKNVRMTASEYKTFCELISNGANNYTYNPSVIPDLVSSTAFPMKMRIRRPKKNDQSWNGGLIFYCDIECEGIEYL